MKATELSLLFAILFAGCGGGQSALLRPPPDPTPTPAPPPAPTGVTVNCQTPVPSAGTSQCTATVTPSGAAQTVTWATSAGTITQTGLLTAPTVTANTDVGVMAASTVDATKSGVFSVVVNAPPAPPPVTGVTVMCAPTVNGNTNDMCAASVSPSTVAQTVTWTATGGVSINSSGAFLAPAVSANTNITVTATSTVDITKSGAFTVTILASTAPPPPSGPENLGVGVDVLMRVDSSGAINAAWLTPTGIEFRRSVDGGATFSSAILAIPQPIFGDFLQMQTDSANAVVLLTSHQTNADPNPIAQLARSTDGQTFILHTVPNVDLVPSLAVEPSGAIDIAWTAGGRLQEIRSTDGGATYSPATTVWSTPDDILEVAATVGLQGQLYLFWGHEVGGTCDIFFASSLDGSQTFSTPKQISNPNTGCNAVPMPQVDAAGNLYVDWASSGTVIYFAQSGDQGQTFTLNPVIQNSIEAYTSGFVVGPSGEIDLTYGASAIGDNFDTFFSRSKDKGVTFETPVKLNLPTVLNFTGGGDPAVAVDSTGKITVAWEDDSNGSYSGDDDIYERTSTDGVTFSAAVDLSKTTDQTEIFPQIIVSQPNVRYFVWSDTTNPNATNPVVSVFFDAVP